MKVDATTMGHLGNLKYEGNRVIITERLARGAYTKVNDVLVACGGKWTRKVQAHVFTTDPVPVIADVLDTGMVTTDADMGFFATPSDVAREVLMHLDPPQKQKITILEPSAGEGDLVIFLKTQLPQAHFTCMELHEGRAKKLRLLFPFDQVLQDDFLASMHLALCQFDYVAMNPQFNKSGVHIDHVRRAFEYLKPGGRLVSVLPTGVMDRDDRKHADFRAFVEGNAGYFYRLPALSFRVSGTDVNTCLAIMEKST
jgi:hypothetical protein